MTIKGVIFDMDGVVLDSLGMWKHLGARYLALRGIVARPGIDEDMFPMSLEEGAAYLRREYGLPASEREIARGISDMIASFYRDAVAEKRGARELISYFAQRGTPMVIATSSPREHIASALTRLGLMRYFSGMLTTTETGASKRSPVIYRKCAALMGTELYETLVIEDSLYALRTAHDAGFRTVGVFDDEGETDREGVKRTADLFGQDAGAILDLLRNKV